MKIPLLVLPLLVAASAFAEKPQPTPTARVAAEAPTWIEDAAAALRLSQGAREAGYRIQSRSGENGRKEYKVVTPAGFLPGNSRTFAGVEDLHAAGDFLVWRRQDVVVYQHLLKKSVVLSSDGGTREDFDIVAHIANGTLSSVVNSVDGANRTLTGTFLLGDGLKRLGFSDAEISAVTQRVAERTQGRPYVISTATRSRVLVSFGSEVAQVHPVANAPEGR